MTVVYLLRHAESAPSRDVLEADWPLSKEGKHQALNLRDPLGSLKIDHIYSSPYKRAIASVEAFAREYNHRIEIALDLRERKLLDVFSDRWLEILKQAWMDFDFALSECESGNSCQIRISKCIDDLAAGHSGRNILVSTHGNAIGLFLNLLDDSFGFEEWAAIKVPDLFKITYQDGVRTWDKSFTYP